MRHREAARGEFGEQRLDVAERRLAGRRVADMADCRLPGEAADDVIAVEIPGHMALRAMAVEALAVPAGDAGGFLATVLRSEERRVGKAWVSTCRYRWSQYH